MEGAFDGAMHANTFFNHTSTCFLCETRQTYCVVSNTHKFSNVDRRVAGKYRSVKCSKQESEESRLLQTIYAAAGNGNTHEYI